VSKIPDSKKRETKESRKRKAQQARKPQANPLVDESRSLYNSTSERPHENESTYDGSDKSPYFMLKIYNMNEPLEKYSTDPELIAIQLAL